MASCRLRVPAAEARNAESASSGTRFIPRPPLFVGNVACVQLLSVKVMLRIFSRPVLSSASYLARLWCPAHGTVRRVYSSLGDPREREIFVSLFSVKVKSELWAPSTASSAAPSSRGDPSCVAFSGLVNVNSLSCVSCLNWVECCNNSCNNLLSSVYSLLVNNLRYVRLYIKLLLLLLLLLLLSLSLIHSFILLIHSFISFIHSYSA